VVDDDVDAKGLAVFEEAGRANQTGVARVSTDDSKNSLDQWDPEVLIGDGGFTEEGRGALFPEWASIRPKSHDDIAQGRGSDSDGRGGAVVARKIHRLGSARCRKQNGKERQNGGSGEKSTIFRVHGETGSGRRAFHGLIGFL
jgi:hypothetical protein